MRFTLICLTILFVSTNASTTAIETTTTTTPAGTTEATTTATPTTTEATTTATPTTTAATIDYTRSEPAEGICLQVTLPSTCGMQMTMITTTGQFAQGTCTDTTQCTGDTSAATAALNPILTSCSGSSIDVYCPPVPPIDIDWAIPMSPDTITASIGDKLKFSWSGMHNVYTMASSTCDFSGQSAITGGDTATTGDVEYEITSLPLFFGCEVGGHCTAGQKLTVGCAQSLPGTAPTYYTFATGATVNAVLELTGVSCANGYTGTAVATCSTEASVTLSGCTVDTSTTNAASDSSVSKMVVTFSFVATLFLMM